MTKLNVQSQNIFLYKNKKEKEKIQFFGVINLFQVYDDPLQMLNEDIISVGLFVLLPARREFLKKIFLIFLIKIIFLYSFFD